MITARLPDGHIWLRLVDAGWSDPLDPSFAQRTGGRWNPPDSWPTLYLNENLTTVHAQLRHMFSGRGIDPDDLDDDAPVRLVAATLPRRQEVCDVRTLDGTDAVGLPPTYPDDGAGGTVGHSVTRAIAIEVHHARLRGVWCRSAAGTGHELAWYPATRSSATAVWSRPKPLGVWRRAVSLTDIG